MARRGTRPWPARWLEPFRPFVTAGSRDSSAGFAGVAGLCSMSPSIGVSEGRKRHWRAAAAALTAAPGNTAIACYTLDRSADRIGMTVVPREAPTRGGAGAGAAAADCCLHARAARQHASTPRAWRRSHYGGGVGEVRRCPDTRSWSGAPPPRPLVCDSFLRSSRTLLGRVSVWVGSNCKAADTADTPAAVALRLLLFVVPPRAESSREFEVRARTYTRAERERLAPNCEKEVIKT